MNQRQINKEIRAIHALLEIFEKRQKKINTSLRSVTSVFNDPQDIREYQDKTDAFCTLFMLIHGDMDDIIEKYGRLLKKAER